MEKRIKSATEEPQGIESIIGQYIDPEDTLSVMAVGDKLIINSTQVSRENILKLTADLADKGVTVVVIDGHPSTYNAE